MSKSTVVSASWRRSLRFPLLLLLAGVAQAGCSGAAVMAPERVAALSPERLMATVRLLASERFGGRRPGTPGHQAAEAYLVSAFEAAGLQPVPGLGFRQRFGSGTNVVGLVPGAGALAADVVVIGAHYDHLGVKEHALYAGANDNASGVAVLLAIARSLAVQPPAVRRALLVVAFDAEEQGFAGSQAFVARPPVPLARVSAAVVLDMLGRPGHPAFGDRLLVLGLEKSAALRAAFARSGALDGAFEALRAGLHLAEEIPGGRRSWSDYAPFRDAGVPFAFVSAGMTSTYHTPRDRPESLSPTLLAGGARWLDRWARGLLTAPERPAFDAASEDYAHDIAVVVRMLRRALDPALGYAAMPGVRPDLLRAHLRVLEPLLGSANAPLSRAQIRELRRAATRLNCYMQPPDAPMARVCNLF